MTSARNNIFWSSKKHLVADTPFCQKQQKTRFRPSPGRRTPGPLKEAGSPRSIFILFIVSDWGECHLTRTFFGLKKKTLFLAKAITLWNLKNTYNCIERANFNHDSPKINLKNLSSPTVLDTEGSRNLKLNSYVLETKTKLLIQPIFDLCLRSENIEFWKTACNRCSSPNTPCPKMH